MPRSPKKPTTPAARRKVWVKALRSGRYKQCRNRLQRGTGTNARYCCLGVALKVCNLADNKDSHIHESFLSDKNLRLMGMTNRRQENLAAANDELRLSFKEIADIIEGHKRVPGQDDAG